MTAKDRAPPRGHDAQCSLAAVRRMLRSSNQGQSMLRKKYLYIRCKRGLLWNLLMQATLAIRRSQRKPPESPCRSDDEIDHPCPQPRCLRRLVRDQDLAVGTRVSSSLVLFTKHSSNFFDFNPFFTCMQNLPASLIGEFGRALAPKLSNAQGRVEGERAQTSSISRFGLGPVY